MVGAEPMQRYPSRAIAAPGDLRAYSRWRNRARRTASRRPDTVSLR